MIKNKIFKYGFVAVLLVIFSVGLVSVAHAVVITPVEDTTPPTVTAPASVTLGATQASGAVVGDLAALSAFLSSATATDNIDPSPFNLPSQVDGVDVDSSTVFPFGTTNVTFRFIDAGGNLGEATASVTVILGKPILYGAVTAKGVLGSQYYADVKITNTGNGNARNLTISSLVLRTLTGTGTVTSISPAFPLNLNSLDVGEAVTTRLYFNRPTTVLRFSITENGTVQDILGTKYNYSIAQSILP